MTVLEKIKTSRTYCDGGTGTLLQNLGLQPGELPERWNLQRPETIRALHRDYFAAGADIVRSNTFGANRLKFGDELEAVIAAVYLDGGIEAAFALVGRLLEKPLSGDPFEQILDAKSRLNILSQQHGGHTPVYEVVASEGSAPHQTFTVRVCLGGECLGQADGPSKQAAQQAAAQQAINRINERQCNRCD